MQGVVVAMDKSKKSFKLRIGDNFYSFNYQDNCKKIIQDSLVNETEITVIVVNCAIMKLELEF